MNKSPADAGVKVPQLLPYMRALARGGEVPGGGLTNPIGVRALKNQLSKLLNDATTGQVTIIEAGGGGSVLLIGADALAEALREFDRSYEMTFGAALDSLPHATEKLPPLDLQGNRPTLHLDGMQ
jgi:hypothetical protein